MNKRASSPVQKAYWLTRCVESANSSRLMRQNPSRAVIRFEIKASSIRVTVQITRGIERDGSNARKTTGPAGSCQPGEGVRRRNAADPRAVPASRRPSSPLEDKQEGIDGPWRVESSVCGENGRSINSFVIGVTSMGRFRRHMETMESFHPSVARGRRAIRSFILMIDVARLILSF